MKFHGSGHYSDYLHLSWWDALRLVFGGTLRVRGAGLVVRVTRRPSVPPTTEDRYAQR